MGQPLGIFGLLPDGRIAAMDPHEEGQRNELLAIDRKTGEKTVLHKTEVPTSARWSIRGRGA